MSPLTVSSFKACGLLFVSILIIITSSHNNYNRFGDHKSHHCVHVKHAQEQLLQEMRMKYENHPYDAENIHQLNRRLLTESETSPIRISAYYDTW